MTQFTAVVRTAQAIVFSLITDHRAQAAAALALALVASALLGSGDASALPKLHEFGRGGR